MRLNKKKTHPRLGTRKERKEVLLGAMEQKKSWTARELHELNLFDEPVTRNYINILLRELYDSGLLQRKKTSPLHCKTPRWSYSLNEKDSFHEQ